MKRIIILIIACFVTSLSYPQDDFQSYGSKAPTIEHGVFAPWCYTTPLVAISGLNNGGYALKRAGMIFCNNCPGDPLTIPYNPEYLYSWDTNLIYETSEFVQQATEVSFSNGDVFRQRWFIETTSGQIFYGNIEENTVTCEDPSTIFQPTVSTCSGEPSKTYNSASICGIVLDQGTSSVFSFGIVYSLSPNPTTSSSVAYASGDPMLTWTVNITGLSQNTLYYYRAFAESNDGIGYGAEYSFTTPSNQTVPILTTRSVTSVTINSATSGGDISDEGGVPIVEKGVCYKIGGTPTYSDSKTSDGSGISGYNSNIVDLMPSTTYHIRAYARNRIDSGGFYVYATGYGQEISFTTASNVSCMLPTVVTNAVNSITISSANGGGNVTSDGGCEVTSKGLCWSTSPNPTTANLWIHCGSGVGSFSGNIINLTSGTTYYVRAFAVNTSGTAYGNEVSFTTPSCPSIGDSYQGGLIAYVFQSGDEGYVSGECHGIITSSSHIGFYMYYDGALDWFDCGATETAIGSGQRNTNKIIDPIYGYGTYGYAATACNNYSNGGYSDWFLPSSGEAQKIYDSRALLGGDTLFPMWTSTETEPQGAYAMDASLYNTNKISSLMVRPVRYF